MKKKKIFKIIWIVGVYLILVLTLYLVVLYKVRWEHKDLNKYLYFYDCNDNLCTSDVFRNDYYSKVVCENRVCPFVNNIIKNNVILEKDGKMWLYNYATGKVIDENYNQYRYLNDNLLIVTNESLKQGIIDLNGDVIVESQYEYIADYKDGYVAYKVGSLYGIDSSKGNAVVENKFTDILLINSELYAGFMDGSYRVYSYTDNGNTNLETFKYIVSIDGIIFTFNNNKIDILTTDFDSTLLMKINTFYSYATEKERESLNFRSDGKYIYFDVYTNENEYSSYKYSIDSKKIV